MQFDHEKLDVYQAELEFVTWVTPLLAEVSHPHGRRVAEVCDQLDRASLSALLNTAEGQRETSASRTRQVFRRCAGFGERMRRMSGHTGG